MIYVISPLQLPTDEATLKAKTDVAHFFGEIGFRELFLSRYVKWNDEHWRSEILGMISTVGEEDVVIYQIPTYADPEVESAVVELVHKQKAKIIAFVHDVEYLRFPDQYDKNQVIGFFNSFDGLIVGTEIVKQRLAEDGVNVPMIPSGPWGYVQPIAYRRPTFSQNIHYAGNLVPRKAGFLQNVPDGLHFKVYGSADGNPDLPYSLSSSVEYLGSHRQEELGLALNNGYGLLWDADTENKMDPYSKINMTHKFSLYLSVGLPVIAYNQSAIGRYVNANGLGIVIDSVENLPNIIQGITEDDYNHIVDKVASISGLIRSGRHNQMAALQAVLAVKGSMPF
ncbi:galactofuranosyltransferase [Lacticaseibacillus rhamnosus]|uniref:galactofuranosyltransferase n=1 Tax=Lacticaseibacillus rhamnosus TaxID=47715 RepID=UPI0008A2AA5F|nr:galactofuranosyltransferase [Lacticaseibacillus rhamnosus]MDK7183245.1 galactofuranosyltransferase [Lacticaseibacillus rhamnosus]MDK7240128.1 galactofuranosyltransferase [Lacticaseibacillus rhamnosus]MDT8865208.1 galactofuranosyltransferase [Lacticaseibacillus rhamnosus]OFN13636.1 galactofuranosyltransferase [Lactobacillus sp. HMSC072E07]